MPPRHTASAHATRSNPTQPPPAVVVRLRTDQRGEGVISAAIAVLIMALLGAVMWTAFSSIFDGASTRTADTVEQIGG